MEKRRMVTLFIVAATLLFLLTSQTGDMSSILSDTVEQEPNQNIVTTIFDPSIAMALADTGLAQQVSSS